MIEADIYMAVFDSDWTDIEIEVLQNMKNSSIFYFL